MSLLKSIDTKKHANISYKRREDTISKSEQKVTSNEFDEFDEFEDYDDFDYAEADRELLMAEQNKQLRQNRDVTKSEYMERSDINPNGQEVPRL